jgi:hypothetical protein
VEKLERIQNLGSGVLLLFLFLYDAAKILFSVISFAHLQEKVIVRRRDGRELPALPPEEMTDIMPAVPNGTITS